MNNVHKKVRTPPHDSCRAWACCINAVRLLASIVYAATADGAAAKNLGALTDFVAPAYIAMNFAVMCAHDDSGFLSRTIGPRGTVLQYAEHVKNEATASLTFEEAVIVLKGAADVARAVARLKLYDLARYPDMPAEIQRWCADYATPFIRDLVKNHELAHPLLLQQIERAKQ